MLVLALVLVLATTVFGVCGGGGGGGGSEQKMELHEAHLQEAVITQYMQQVQSTSAYSMQLPR